MTETKTDWNAVRMRYVQSNKTLAEVATEFGIHHAGVEKRAHREGWTDERQKLADSVRQQATSELVTQRAKELSKLNEDNLRVARAVQAQIGRHLQESQQNNQLIASRELRQLAGALAEVQKVARLALGASTDNHELNGGTTPIALTSVPIKEYQEAIKRALEEF
jgi:DNA-binding MurR/RpiR family transcriptional regulator